MTTYPSLSLTTDWMCDYFEPEPPTLYEFQHGLPVTTLRGWSPEKRYDRSWVAWLQKSFTLEITDVCVNYSLLIETAPMGRIWQNIRGQHWRSMSPMRSHGKRIHWHFA